MTGARHLIFLLGICAVLNCRPAFAQYEATRRVVCSNAGVGYEAFPDVCMDENGHLVCVFYEGYGHVSVPRADLPRGGRICMVKSTNYGKTWSKPRVVADTQFDDRDPSIVCLSDGTLLCNSFVRYAGNPPDPARGGFELQITRSTDNGRTWGEPEPVETSSPHAWACSSPIRELSDGSLILGVYFEEGAGAAGPRWGYGAVVKSFDGGKTWPFLSEIHPDRQVYRDAETDVLELDNGRLVTALRASGGETTYCYSDDMGETWGPLMSFGYEGHCPYLLQTRAGILVCAHRLPNTAISYSLDRGVSWLGPFQIDSVIGAYPSMVELPDGTILCVYYEEGEGSDIRAARFRVSEKGLDLLRW